MILNHDFSTFNPVKKAKARYPIIYPPVIPKRVTNPLLYPANTGRPMHPNRIYKAVAITPFFHPNQLDVNIIIKVASEIGISPTGMDKGAIIEILAAIKAI